MAEEQKVVTPEVTEKAPEQATKAPRENKGNRKPNGKGPRKFNKGAKREEKLYEERVIAINRVSKTVKGGRHMRFSAVVVVGDGKGKFGFGTGKAMEVPDAIKKAIQAANKNLIKVPLTDNRTIAHEVNGVAGAAKVVLIPAAPGTGVIAGGAVRAVLELAGVQDILSKSLGSRTKNNMAAATINALKQIKTPEHVAQLRGKTVEEILG